MDREYWTSFLVRTLIYMLTEFMQKHGHDAAQNVIQKVSSDLAFNERQVMLGLAGLPKVASLDSTSPFPKIDDHL